MNAKDFIDNVRQQIANDQLAAAIDQLHVLLENSPKLNELLLQSARHNDILKQIRLGIVDFESANITKNQIRLGLLDLVSQVEVEEAKPAIKKELEQAISIVNSKNVVVGSNISAGGDLQIGDKTIHTESETSKRLRLFLFFLVPVLAIGGAYLWYQNVVMKQPLNLKVLIENQTPNPELTEPVGLLTLTIGGETDSKKAISTEALFENIPSNFKSDIFRLQYVADGFVQVDTAFQYTKSINLDVRRNNDLALVKGYVYEEGTEPLEGIEGVKVSINCCTAFTDASGRFSLEIPFEHQLKKQRLELFKGGFHQKSIMEPIIKGTEIQTYLSRK